MYMIRVNYHLTVEQLKLLKTLSRETGLSVAELIRRAIDHEYPKRIENDSHRLGTH